MVLTADCLPVALGGEGAVAMLHAGWRGLAAGVLEEGVRALRELGGAGEIVAVIGPGAGPAATRSARRCTRRSRAPIASGPHARDRPAAIARERLPARRAPRCAMSRLCTICDERFFSHRREGARAGRQAGVAWLS